MRNGRHFCTPGFRSQRDSKRWTERVRIAVESELFYRSDQHTAGNSGANKLEDIIPSGYPATREGEGRIGRRLAT